MAFSGCEFDLLTADKELVQWGSTLPKLEGSPKT